MTKHPKHYTSPQTKQSITLPARVPKEMYDLLNITRNDLGKTWSKFIEHILRDYLESVKVRR